MTRLRESPLGKKLLLTMGATTVIVIVIVAFVAVLWARTNVELAGLTTARAISNQVKTLRTFYTEKVVAPAKSAGMEVNYDFAEKEQTLPLPATMVNALGEAIRAEYPGADVKLYSDYPFLHQKQIKEKDDFEKAALKALEQDPDKPFYRLETVDDRTTMRYAVADVMRDSCVACHNSHPQSPKRDWKTGDVRGVVEVMVPVDEVRSQLNQGNLIQWLVALGGLLAIVLITGTAFARITSTLDGTIATIAGTSSQIGSTVEMHERIASDQATAMNQTTTTMEQLGESSRLSAQQAETAAEETTQAMTLAEDGSKTVQETLDVMSDLREKVGSLTHEILALNDRIEQIGEISKFVGDLANQTNLLAMNAAVEAAHAGQHGKGFAVVATEIRKLADQSTKSVSRISDLLTDIQQATKASVTATEQGAKVVDLAVMLAERTADVFNNLGNSVGVAVESVQQISLNNKEQASAINQVFEAIESLNVGARESVGGLKQTSDGLQTLNRIVSNLQALVGTDHAH